MSNELECFVISPIGQDGSEIREHADDVLNYIIRPALIQIQNEGGPVIHAIRSDEIGTPGKIEEQMLSAILNSCLCLVILSGKNPNVYYELAIAQSAGRPVVLMCLKDESLPFDVKDYRTIYYDLKPKNIMEKTWVPILARQVLAVLDDDYSAPSILNKYMPANGITKSYILNAQSKEFGDAPEFNRTVEQTKSTCRLMGISLVSWGSERSIKVLKDLGNRRVDTRILTMDHENPALEYLINERIIWEDLNVVRTRSKNMAVFFKKLSDEYPTFEARVMKKGLPHNQVIITDHTALILQYLFSRGTDESPLLQVPAGTELYDVFVKEFDELWQLNEPE